MDQIEAIEPVDEKKNRDNEAQQPRNDEDQEASDKGNDWHDVRSGNGDVHGCFLVSMRCPRWEARQELKRTGYASVLCDKRLPAKARKRNGSAE